MQRTPASGAGSMPFLTLPNWLKAAAQCGFNIEPVFRRLGIATDLIHLEAATIEPAQVQALMQACVRLSKSRHFPFVLGETFAFDYLPDIATYLATSPTLRDTLPVFDWVRALVNPSLRVHLEEDAANAALVLEFAPGLQAERPFAEAALASIVKFGRTLLGARARFRHLCLPYPPPSYAAEYARHFGTELRFGQPRYAVVLPRRLLDLPLEGAYPALHRQAEYRVQQQLRRLPQPAGAAGAVERALAQHPELLGQGIGAVAAALSVHPRTLQRRLQAQGHSFAELQSGARLRLALRWLEEVRLDIESISERLGFADRRSFTRAFTRWAGAAPSRYRGRAALPAKV